MLLTVCRRYLNDPSLAEDALQETFIKIFRYIGKYKPYGSFEAWMRRVAVTTTLQMVDKAWYRRPVGEVEEHLLDSQVPDIYAHLNAEEILKLIARLPAGFRVVFNLYAIDGYSHREIGDLLGITESASRSQLTRARKQLIQLLKHQEKVRV